MSIAPPSDIVLDVAQAADPQKLQEAQAKLARIAAGASSGDFAAVLGSASAAPASTPVSLPLYASAPTNTSKPMTPYQKFEAVLLQNLMIDILPKDNNLFGDAASADINRSLLADQLATQIAKTNKIGISQMVQKAHGSSSLTAANLAHPPETLAASSSSAALNALSLPATRRGKE